MELEMADLLYIASGFALLAVFGGYVWVLRRI
jgi:hypothetical protein